MFISHLIIDATRYSYMVDMIIEAYSGNKENNDYARKDCYVNNLHNHIAELNSMT